MTHYKRQQGQCSCMPVHYSFSDCLHTFFYCDFIAVLVWTLIRVCVCVCARVCVCACEREKQATATWEYEGSRAPVEFPQHVDSQHSVDSERRVWEYAKLLPVDSHHSDHQPVQPPPVGQSCGWRRVPQPGDLRRSAGRVRSGALADSFYSDPDRKSQISTWTMGISHLRLSALNERRLSPSLQWSRPQIWQHV